MGIRTVAEYAESEAIIEALRRRGIGFALCYGLGRPVPLFEEAATKNDRVGVAAR